MVEVAPVVTSPPYFLGKEYELAVTADDRAEMDRLQAIDGIWEIDAAEAGY
jgi:hypothetical protein